MSTLTALFWACAVAVGPLGTFPLGDDWAFAEAVRLLSRVGALKLSDAGAPTLLGQVAWGWLFCLPGGFSYGALRLSTLSLAWLGLLAFHRSLRRLGVRSGPALAATLALLFNPLFFVLSFTFMTDVQALAWMLLAAHAYLVGLQERRARWTIAGSALAAMAYLVRQTGACVPAGFCLWLWLKGERRWRAYAAVAGLPAMAVLFHAAWSALFGLTAAFRVTALAGALRHLSDPVRLGTDILSRSAGAGIYIGMFLIPFVPGLELPRSRFGVQWRALGALAALWASLRLLGLSPATGNVVGRFGLGTCSLGSSCVFKASGWFGRPWFWGAATAAGFASLAAFVARVPCGREFWCGEKGAYASGFVLAFLLSWASANYFDRYCLVLFPPAILAAAGAVSGSWTRLAPGLAALAVWSFLGTRDYMAWSAAKWQAGEGLVAMGYRPEDVSAGQEWDCLYGFDAGLSRLRRTRPGVPADPSDEGLWWEPSRYRAMVSFAAAAADPALERVGAVPYSTPLARETQHVYLWRRR